MKIAVIGTGYVGLVTGAMLAHLGNEVTCVDKDQKKLEIIRSGVSPIYEPGLDEILQRVIEDGLLKVSDSVKQSTEDADMVFIAVGTPPNEDGSPDLSAVRGVAEEIASGIKKYTVVVNKSTVPVGTAHMVAEIIATAGVDRSLFDVVSNPEFLREGCAVLDSLEPDRLVVGSKSERAALQMVLLYAPLQRPVLLTDLHSAELIKYANNSFLAMKISFINAISRLCEKCEANISDVSRGIGADKRIGPAFLFAGLGWGGSCFPKDVQGLLHISDTLGYDFKLLKAVWDINEEQTVNFLGRLKSHIGELSGKTIAVLGLAFKDNTDDVRSSKAIDIVKQLTDENAIVRTYDPVAMDNAKKIFPDIFYCKDAYDACKGADALLVVTEWKEFRSLDLARLGLHMKQKYIFDGRLLFDPKKAKRLGFQYFTIGRADSNSTD